MPGQAWVFRRPPDGWRTVSGHAPQKKSRPHLWIEELRSLLHLLRSLQQKRGRLYDVLATIHRCKEIRRQKGNVEGRSCALCPGHSVLGYSKPSRDLRIRPASLPCAASGRLRRFFLGSMPWDAAGGVACKMREPPVLTRILRSSSQPLGQRMQWPGRP